MCERRDSLIEVSGAQAPELEISQESPQGSDQFLGGVSPAVAGSGKHELSYLHRFPTRGVPTQSLEQSGGATNILAQRGLCRATMLSKPIAKRNDQFGFTSFVVDNKSRILWRFPLCGGETKKVPIS